ncbi:MAG: BlaI/MecI/CopY family transcriptional regulator [Pseudomonadota bacterium]
MKKNNPSNSQDPNGPGGNNPSPVNPSPTELLVLRPLWRDGQLSAREVHEATARQTGWTYSTTRKTLDRMVAKDLLRVEPVHGMKTFIPTRKKVVTLAGLIRSFSRTVLGTDTPLPVATFVNSPLINDSDLAELERLLETLSDEDSGHDPAE